MAGFFGKFIIEWECLKPEIYNETKGKIEIIASSQNDAKEKFLKINPDYKVIKIEPNEQ